MKNHHKKRLTRAQKIALSKSAPIKGRSVPEVWADEEDFRRACPESLPPQRSFGETFETQEKAIDARHGRGDAFPEAR